MSNQDITDASAALGRLAQFGRALADADKIIAGLAAAEQVGRELDSAISAKRAEIETLAAEIGTKQDALIVAQAATDGEIAKAKGRAKSIIDAADKKAAGIEKAANDKAVDAEARAQEWAAQEAEAKAAVDVAKAELTSLQARIAELKGKIVAREEADAALNEA